MNSLDYVGKRKTTLLSLAEEIFLSAGLINWYLSSRGILRDCA
jgi:hypothetical protein